jgi:hypothetical protein
MTLGRPRPKAFPGGCLLLYYVFSDWQVQSEQPRQREGGKHDFTPAGNEKRSEIANHVCDGPADEDA